jgi:vacuolar protein sorting-associated protein 13A/C
MSRSRWFTNPLKELLGIVFSRFLAPYVENLDMGLLNLGIVQGQVTLGKLRIKKGALDSFRLPIDVSEGHLGKFSLSLHWFNLGNQPVEVLIEDVYLLVVPRKEDYGDLDELKRRMQDAKLERLQSAEVLHMQATGVEGTEDSAGNQGFIASFLAKLLNNIQVTVKNVHIRYEDNISVPGHPFAVGVTLSSFSAVSVDENWVPAFIEGSSKTVHKLAKLEYLAGYFDTDTQNLSGQSYETTVERFSSMIAREGAPQDHQFILKPVSGEGRVVLRHKATQDAPRFDIELMFPEIGVLLDDHQFRDIISLLETFPLLRRKSRFAKYRRPEVFRENRPRALLTFAGSAILDSVRERRHRWTWAFFAERRDDRRRYVELFKKKQLNSCSIEELSELEELEKKLSYEDIRFYRSISRSELRKDGTIRKQIEDEKKRVAAQSSGWSSWLPTWSSSSSASSTQSTQASPFEDMTDQQRRELYEVLDYDEKAALTESFELPKEALKTRVQTQLKRGSFALKTDPHGTAQEIISVIFDEFQAIAIQRRDNLEVSTSLGGFSVFDGTTSDTLFPQIVHVKQDSPTLGSATELDSKDPFLSMKFENNPLDERADTVLAIRMRHMEVVYHRGYVEAVYKFFKPPEDRLESVEALLTAAGGAIEGFRKETRAGLEYALQSHKTIDLQVDMKAPIIIIPESISNPKCTHLLIDAGHISMESDLASKEAIRQVQLKRAQQYTDDDYARLESLMYDKLNLKLEDAQFVLGGDLQSCRKALISLDDSSLHIIERVSIDLQVQNSIVPSVVSLARFKISGKLPTLQLNFSDFKYKSILRLIDVTIPRFDKPVADSKAVAPPDYDLSSGFFDLPQTEYNIDETDTEDAEDEQPANDKSREDVGQRQRIFELSFQVTTLRASLYKSQSLSSEKPLGHVSFDTFSLLLSLTERDMKVGVRLGSLSMEVAELGFEPLQLLSSADGSIDGKDLLRVDYTRVQNTSPEYAGFDQDITVDVSTVIFRTAPEPLLTLYDLIMTTFVPSSPSPGEPSTAVESTTATVQPAPESSLGQRTGKIRLFVKLASVEVTITNAGSRIATLSLSTADASVLLSDTMDVHVRLGSLSLSDDSGTETSSLDFKKLMFIAGDHLAEFRYVTFDPRNLETKRGINSSVSLAAASVAFHYLEQPLHDIYVFLLKLARLKGLYDTATEVAVQRASEIERMGFNISIKTPIIIFPSNPSSSRDSLTMRLGEITASNTYQGATPRTEASLSGMQLVSTIFYDGNPSTLKMIDDIAIAAEIIQSGNSSGNAHRPDTEVNIKVSEIKLALTEVQYGMLMALSRSSPRTLAGVPEGSVRTEPAASNRGVVERSPVKPESYNESTVDLRPELDGHPGTHPRTTLDLVLTVKTVKLQLFDRQATTEASLKDHGIARFALSDNSVRVKTISDGAMEAQVVLRSFTMSNTTPAPSKFREIIPAAQHDRNQFMLLYTSSGGSERSSLAVLTVDSPHILFSLAPVFALMEFFTSASEADVGVPEAPKALEKGNPTPNEQAGVQFRVDLHDVSISVLEDDLDSDSQAIRLTVAQISLSQQGILALTMTRAGMALLRMGSPEEARILDDVDLTLTLDSRTLSSHQMTSVDLTFKPIVLRASYRDIMLILTIVNKAIDAYGKQTSVVSSSKTTRPSLATSTPGASRSSGGPAQSIISNRGQTSESPLGTAHVVLSKEQLKASFDGFRLILIGDLHEQPLLHLVVRSFVLGLSEWSGELRAATTLETSINYWNLTNSHWEPLIDPWTFTTSVSRELPSYALATKVTSTERLNVNLSTAFIELALETLNSLSRESEHVLLKARGSRAPYRIRNLTGTTLRLSSGAESDPSGARKTNATIVNDGETIDWRFDDWRTMREHTPSGDSSITVQFVDQAWEKLSSVPVDREGEYTFALRPRTEQCYNRLLCEVRVEANIKIVTLRSTYRVQNRTLYPLEIAIGEGGDHSGGGVIVKLAPGQDYSLPLVKVGRSKLKVQPDQGFGYRWSNPKALEDLVDSQSRSRFLVLHCEHRDPSEATFRFHAFVKTDATGPPSSWRRYPKMDLDLMAPIQLENLLPYNLQYRIYDKDTDQNWRSYLRAGGIMPIHSVELTHLVLLNVEINDTAFKASEFSIINTDGHSDFDTENRLTLQDAQGRKLDLRLNYVRPPDSGGAFKVQIYSPYIVINKTGLPFSVRSVRLNRTSPPQDVAGETQTDTSPFLLCHTSSSGNEFIFSVGKSSWSKTISLEAPTADMALAIPSQGQKNEDIHVGLSWTEGLGKYKLTKVITLAPRFLIKNNLSEAMCFREHSVVPHGRSVLEPGDRVPLYTLRTRDKLLTVAFPGMNNQWSPPISIEDIGSVHFRLRRPGERVTTHLIRADIKMDGATIFVSLNLADDGWPFLIENDSHYTVTLCQIDATHANAESAKMYPTYRLPERTAIPYAWDFPAAREKKLLLAINGSRRAVDILEIGDLVPFKFQDGRGIGVISMDARASGHQQVLRLSDYNEETSPYRPKSRTSSASLRVDSISSGTEAFEAVTDDIQPGFMLDVNLDGIGVSLVNRRVIEVVYLSLEHLKVDYTASSVAQSVNLSCDTVQIDNQLHDATFPVVLQPTPISGQASDIAALPTVQFSLTWLNDQEHGVLFIKYCSILLQALTIQADEDFLYAVYELSKIRGASWEEEQTHVLIEQPVEIPEPEDLASENNLYFEVLELQPIRLSLSFERTDRVSGEEKLELRNPLAVIVNAVTMAVGNVKDAPLEMNALAIKDMRLTPADLQTRIMYHYRQDVLRQLYRILGSADFIGNPVGLFTNVSSGVADIFYEPFTGAVMRGNRDLGVGIAKGAASFVKKTVFGFSDSVTKVTSSIGKGLSAATLDSEYQKRRRMNQRRNKPRHAIYGVTAGAEALASSIASGVEGVVMKPIEGAESEGALGFFKGVGKGLVGAVTKPAVGFFDLASNLSEGVRNTTTVFDRPERERIRWPRHVPPDRVLVPFSEREALGQYWLKDVDNGAYRQEFYVAHINLPGGDGVTLLTADRVLTFGTKKLRLSWDLPLTQVIRVINEDHGIRFVHKTGKDLDKLILVEDKKSQAWFYEQIAGVVKAFNTRRRMDS